MKTVKYDLSEKNQVSVHSKRRVDNREHACVLINWSTLTKSCPKMSFTHSTLQISLLQHINTADKNPQDRLKIQPPES